MAEIGKDPTILGYENGGLGLSGETAHLCKGFLIREDIDGTVGVPVLAEPCLGHITPWAAAFDVEDHEPRSLIRISLLASLHLIQ